MDNKEKKKIVTEFYANWKIGGYQWSEAIRYKWLIDEAKYNYINDLKDIFTSLGFDDEIEIEAEEVNEDDLKIKITRYI